MLRGPASHGMWMLDEGKSQTVSNIAPEDTDRKVSNSSNPR